MTEPRHAAPDEEQPQVVADDRHRTDQETGEVRQPAHAAPEESPEDGGQDAGAQAPAEGRPEGAAPVSDEPLVAEVVDDVAAELKTQLDERTADLQRLTAEYANYRKRVERDRESVITTAKASVASELLPVLDDLERAATHGDLTGAFKAVADKLVSTLQKTGLEPFAHEGEAFDPAVHEAVQHSTSPDVDGPTVTAVLRRGYTFGDKLVRPALVAVTDHEPAPAGAEQSAEES